MFSSACHKFSFVFPLRIKDFVSVNFCTREQLLVLPVIDSKRMVVVPSDAQQLVPINRKAQDAHCLYMEALQMAQDFLSIHISEENICMSLASLGNHLPRSHYFSGRVDRQSYDIFTVLLEEPLPVLLVVQTHS